MMLANEYEATANSVSPPSPPLTRRRRRVRNRQNSGDNKPL